MRERDEVEIADQDRMHVEVDVAHARGDEDDAGGKERREDKAQRGIARKEAGASQPFRAEGDD